jgi:hypothetical protein
MDTLIPGTRTGNFAPCRAGGFSGNHLIHSSFIPAKSASSRRMTVALTTRSREEPAALRMADTFSRHCLVCSWIVSPIFPVAGSCGPVPETNTRPAARTAWLYVGGGAGASDVRMMSLAINPSHPESTHRVHCSKPDLIQKRRGTRNPVKPLNHISVYNETAYEWRMSYTDHNIMDREALEVPEFTRFNYLHVTGLESHFYL